MAANTQCSFIGNTEFENNETIANLTTSSHHSGLRLLRAQQPNDQRGLRSHSLAGRILGSRPGYLCDPGARRGQRLQPVRPCLSCRRTPACTLGQIANINLTGWREVSSSTSWHTPLTNFLFNSSLLVPGQHISIGGPLSGAGNAQSVTAHRIVLRHEGHTGEWVVGSTNTGNGTFSFNSNGLAGVLFDGPVTVYTTPVTQYLGGLTGLSDLSGNSAMALRVVGLVLKDPGSGNPVFVARSVEELQ